MKIAQRVYGYTCDWSPVFLYSVTALVGFFLLWFWYSWVYLPLGCWTAAINSKVVAIQAQVQKLDACQKACSTLSTDVKQLEKSFEQNKNQCKLFSSQNELAAYLFSLCDQFGITLQSFKPSEEKKHDWYTTSSCTCDFLATTEAAQKFYEALQKSCTLLAVTYARAEQYNQELFTHTCKIEMIKLLHS